QVDLLVIPYRLRNNEEDNIWYDDNSNVSQSSNKKKRILSLIDKILQLETGSHKFLNKESKLFSESDVESLENIQCKIENIDISEIFSDTASECVLMNKALNNVLG
ncbi:11666_t:CDS:2, partial [Diversispora eburnea]